MDSVQNSEVTEKLSTFPPVEKVEKFASYMEEEEAEEENEPLLDGPVFAPLIPPLPTFAQAIARIPAEIRPLIIDLPTQIETSFNQGIEQTKLLIKLSPTENVEVIIDKYDTDPTTFHISFYGSEQTGALISSKQATLIKALQLALPNFSFAISPPFRSFSLPKTRRLRYSPVKEAKRSK